MKGHHYIKEPLSKEVLLAYLEGTLPEDAMKEVKHLVDNNPLYKDALEGLRWMDDPESIPKFTSITHSEDKKVRIITMPRLVAVAGLALLITGGVLVVRMANQQSTDSLFTEHFEKPDTAVLTEKETHKTASQVADDGETKSDEEESVGLQFNAIPESPTSMVVQEEQAPTVSAPPPLDQILEMDDVFTDAEMDEDALPQKSILQEPSRMREKSMQANSSPPPAAEGAHAETANLTTLKAHYHDSRYTEAIEEANTLLSSYPQHTEVLLYKGLAYLGLEQPAQAMIQFDVILGQGGAFVQQAEWYKSLSLIKQGKKKEAIELLRGIEAGSGPFAEQATALLKDL